MERLKVVEECNVPCLARYTLNSVVSHLWQPKCTWYYEVGVVHSTWPSRAMWHKKKEKKKKTLHMVCTYDKFCDIRERIMTIRSEIWTTTIRSLGFRGIREWVILWGLIIQSLGWTHLTRKYAMLLWTWDDGSFVHRQNYRTWASGEAEDPRPQEGNVHSSRTTVVELLASQGETSITFALTLELMFGLVESLQKATWVGLAVTGLHLKRK